MSRGVAARGERAPAPANPQMLLVEGPRAMFEAAQLSWALPGLTRAPRGDGHPVLVLPGYFSHDASTLVLRSLLEHLGYAVFGWGGGLNTEMPPAIEEKLLTRLEAVHDEAGEPLSLVGWSLGGVYARFLALERPAWVRHVLTIGSPFHGERGGHDFRWIYRAVNGGAALPRDARERLNSYGAPPSVPATAIYSRSDGIAAWRACIDPEGSATENLEVDCSHMGMGFHPTVLALVADRLAAHRP